MKHKKSSTKKKAVKKTQTIIATEPPIEYGLEDHGNGQRFVAQHGGNVRFIRQWGRWLVWDGRIWNDENDGRLQQMAAITAQSIYREADSRPSKAKAINAHARSTLSVKGRKMMLESASGEVAVLAKPGDFNQQPRLFNVENGTIDLTTGELRPHQQDDFLTKIAPVEYDSEATFPIWDGFLEQMVPDPSVRDYLQRACYYTLHGLTEEHVFFFLVGISGSGKSTFLDAIRNTMGRMYATEEEFNVLLKGAEKRFAMARHDGSRMVVAREVSKHATFDDAFVKKLTGDTTQQAEEKFCPKYEFEAQWTWWLAANDRPHVDIENDGMWRRLREIPFMTKLSEEHRDVRLRTILQSDPRARKAILAWIMKGRESYQKIGLSEPPAIRLACDEYKNSEDNFIRFFRATYVLDPKGKVKTADVESAYEEWCLKNHEEQIEGLNIPRRMGDGYKFDRTLIGKRRLAGWRGFRLHDAMTDAPQEEEQSYEELWSESEEQRLAEEANAYREMISLIEESI